MSIFKNSFQLVARPENMCDSVLKHLRPLLWACNIFGFTYIITNNIESAKHAEVFMGIPAAFLYFLSVYKTIIRIFSVNPEFNLSLISSVVDPLSLSTCMLTFVTKWAYYLLRRDKMKQLVFEVS